MKKIWEGPLSGVDSAIAKNYDILTRGEEDYIERDTDYMIVAQPYEVKIAELHVYCKEGVYFSRDEIGINYEPDFSLTLVYGDNGEGKYLYWEQEGFEVTLVNFFQDKFSIDQISQMHCELWAEKEDK